MLAWSLTCIGADRAAQEFDYAKTLADEGFFDLAELVYKDAIAAYPDHEKIEEATLAVAFLKAQMKRFDEALADYQAFLKKYSYSKLKADAEVGMAEIHFQQKDLEKASQEFKQILDTSKDGASDAYVRAQFGFAWCLMENGKYQEAAEKFKEFALIWQGFAQEEQARLLMGDCYMKLKEYDKALDAYNKARAKTTSEDRVILSMFGMGRANMAKENYKAALLAFDAALKRDPASPHVPVILIQKAECLAKSGDDEATKKVLEEVMVTYEGTPHYKAALDKLATFGAGGFDALQPEAQRFAVAEKEFREGNCEAAITRYEGLLKKFPKGAFAAKSQQAIARCYAKMDKMGQAGDAFMAVAEKYPDDPIAVESLNEAIRAYGAAKDNKGKEKAVKRLAERYPEAGKGDSLLLQAATMAYDEKDYQRAAKEFLDLVAKFPRSKHCETAVFQAGFCYYLIPDYNLAAQTFARLLKEHPKSDRRAEASCLRGESLWRLKKLEDAAAELGACLRYGPSRDIEARADFWLGLCFEGQKKLDQALAAFNKAAALAGEDPGLAPQARFRAALVYSQQKNPEKCAERLVDLLKDFPTYSIPPHIMDWLADRLMQQNDFANAAHVADLIVSRYANDKSASAQVEKAYVTGGQAKVLAKQWDPALEMFQKLLHDFPTTPQAGAAKLGIAECYKQLKKYDKAEEQLEGLIGESAGDLLIEAQAALAGVFEDEGKPEEAVRVLERAILLVPARLEDKAWPIRLHSRLGKLYEARQKKSDAIRVYRALTQIPTTDPEMLRLQKEAQQRLAVLSAE